MWGYHQFHRPTSRTLIREYLQMASCRARRQHLPRLTIPRRLCKILTIHYTGNLRRMGTVYIILPPNHHPILGCHQYQMGLTMLISHLHILVYHLHPIQVHRLRVASHTLPLLLPLLALLLSGPAMIDVTFRILTWIRSSIDTPVLHPVTPE